MLSRMQGQVDARCQLASNVHCQLSRDIRRLGCASTKNEAKEGHWNSARGMNSERANKQKTDKRDISREQVPRFTPEIALTEQLQINPEHMRHLRD